MKNLKLNKEIKTISLIGLLDTKIVKPIEGCLTPDLDFPKGSFTILNVDKKEFCGVTLAYCLAFAKDYKGIAELQDSIVFNSKKRKVLLIANRNDYVTREMLKNADNIYKSKHYEDDNLLIYLSNDDLRNSGFIPVRRKEWWENLSKFVEENKIDTIIFDGMSSMFLNKKKEPIKTYRNYITPLLRKKSILVF
jgi:hypothetical protein